MKIFGMFLVALLFVPSWAFARSYKPKIVNKAVRMIDHALVNAPVPNETCFAPENPCDIKLSKFIESATTTLDVAIFDINLDQVVHQILLKTKKIPVRILVDKRQAKGANSLVPLLIKAGANVRLGHQRGIMHNKFTIVDGKMLELGSFNYTNGASFKNNENQLYLNDPKIVSDYKKRFEKIWAEGDAVKVQR